MSSPPLPPRFVEPPAPSPGWLPGGLKTALRVLVSAGLLAYLAAQIDVAESFRVLRQARVPWLAALLALFVFGRLFAAYRWHVLLRRRCEGVTLADAVRLTFVSSFVGSFLPGSVGMEAMRVYGLARTSCGLSEAFASVFIDRVLGVISLILCVFLGLTLTTRMLPDAIAWSAAACLVLLVATCFVLVHPRVRRVLGRVTPDPVTASVARRFGRLFAALDAYQRDRRLLAWGLALALALQAVRVLSTIVAARALRVDDVRVMDFVVFVPIIMFVIMWPISIGGVGVRETAFAGLFSLAGVAPEAAVALSLLIFLTDLVATLPGAWLYARGDPTPIERRQEWSESIEHTAPVTR